MKDIGKMTCSMEKVSKHGLMAHVIKVTTKKERSTAKVHTYGAMDHNM